MELISGMFVQKLVRFFFADSKKGMFAIRNDREWVIEEDFFKAARKIKDQKKLETKLEYHKL